ncbi:DMT family transporter [Sanyastnella coralliicola]|uniref:DMT family transporter n=1 Tax=Sanyastnella coralliicola TaxID=3069118 RepID=UPI0027BA9C1E|nr:DMT family transporter [Longitalea sp. SCSIO 12813]
MTDQKPSIEHFLLLGFLALIWGSSFILMKIGLFGLDGDGEVFSSYQIAAMRIGIAGLVLSPIIIRKWKQIQRQDLLWMMAVGMIGNTIPAFLFTSAQLKLASSIAGILNSLTPLFTLVVAMIVFGNRFTSRQIIGLLLGFAGAVGMITLKDSNGETHLLSMGLIVIATVCYAFSVNIIRNKLAGVSSMLIAAVALGTMAIPNLIWLATTNVGTVITEHPEGVNSFLATFVLAAVGTAMALVFFNGLIKDTSALFASSVTYLIPIVAAMWGYLDEEHLTLMHLAFAMVILIGVYLVNRSKPVSRSKAS